MMDECFSEWAARRRYRPVVRLFRGVALAVASLPVFARAELDVVDAFPQLRFAAGTDDIIGLASAPGRTNELFVTGQNGRIFVVTNLSAPTKTLFLDLTAQTFRTGPGSEAGLVGLAFHPQYSLNGQFYVHYTRTNLTTRRMYDTLSRFRVDPLDSARAVPSSEQMLFSQVDVWPDRQGGDLQFGPDGYLYVSLGDGGGHGGILNSQRIDKDFFSGILRLDVDERTGSLAPNPHAALGAGYRIPQDNPFVGVRTFMGRTVHPGEVRTEFWAVGLRNPLRMSFDSLTGELYAGDVGENRVEEVDRVVRGGNYGWNYLEGTLPFSGARPLAGKLLPPLYQYPHLGGEPGYQGRMVIGGLVYRGSRYPDLQGKYVFGDRDSRQLWVLSPRPGGGPVVSPLLTTEHGISAFGLHPLTDEILMVEPAGGRILKLAEKGETGYAAVPLAGVLAEPPAAVPAVSIPAADPEPGPVIEAPPAVDPGAVAATAIGATPVTVAGVSAPKPEIPATSPKSRVAYSTMALSVPIQFQDESSPSSSASTPEESGLPLTSRQPTLGTASTDAGPATSEPGDPAVDATAAPAEPVPLVAFVRDTWELGTNEDQPRSAFVPYHEFGIQNDRIDDPPGLVTRLPGDPQFRLESNPGPDDDFYFSGIYPAGFNSLREILEVPNDEPTIAWERSLTAGDPANRIHFTLSPSQVIPGASLRLSFEFGTGGSMVDGVFRSGFSTHDVAVRFRNGFGVRTTLYLRRLSRPTAVILEFTAEQVAAMSGANSIEFIRTGPSEPNTSYWLDYDFVKLEAVPPVRSVWQIGTNEDQSHDSTLPYLEFGAQNEKKDAPPGVVTRLRDDPLYNQATNPVADDDFYFEGDYPAGFNALTASLVVSNDEPASSWERSLTGNDPSNRMHFMLSPAQVASGAWFRLSFEFPAGRSAVDGTIRPGFGVHDVTVGFVNGGGNRTVLYARRLKRSTAAVLEFKASDVKASEGPNTIEFTRVGPLRANMSHWLVFDYVRLEAVSAARIQETRTRAEKARAAAALRTVRLRSALPEIFAPGRSLGYGVETVDGVEYLTLTYARPEPAPEGVTYRVEVSEDMVRWAAGGVAPVESRVEGGLRIITERDSVPLHGKRTRFIRLRLSADDETPGTSPQK